MYDGDPTITVQSVYKIFEIPKPQVLDAYTLRFRILAAILPYFYREGRNFKDQVLNGF